MKKIIIVSCLAMLGLVGVAKAEYKYFTTQSTAVFISSTSNLEVVSIEVENGDDTQYVLMIDTKCTNFATGEFTALSDRSPAIGGYPVASWMTPEIIAQSTYSITGHAVLKYEDSRGDGLRYKNGLFLWTSANGITKTLKLRKFR